MIELFSIIFIGTFIITRILSHKLHNREDDSKSRTLTRKIREKTSFDFHHIHFGFIGLFLSLVIYLIFSFSSFLVVLFAVSLSLVLDQVIPSIFYYNIIKSNIKICYFSKIAIFLAFFLHLITLIISVYLI